MKKVIMTILVIICIAYGSTRVYEVEPHQNCNGWVAGDQYHGVGQTFVAICDSFVWVEFFVGASNDTGYNIQIIEQSTNLPVVKGYAAGGFRIQYQYTQASLERTGLGSIIKGKEYLLKITNARGDSINFYYSPEDPYKYGEIQVGDGRMYPPPQNHSLCDLAARVEGINKVDDNMFGTHLFLTPMQNVWGFQEGWQVWADVAESAGVKWSREAAEWGNFQCPPDSTFHYYKYNTAIEILKNKNINIFFPLCYSPNLYASSAPSGAPDPYKYPPKNLDSAVIHGNSINPNNYWGYYVYRIIKYYGPGGEFWVNQTNPRPITHFSIWNEPEYEFFWNYPDSQYYPGINDDRARCSLYARLCIVADTAAQKALQNNGRSRSDIKLYAGSAHSDLPPPYCNWLNWLAGFGVFEHIDGYEIHPYQCPLPPDTSRPIPAFSQEKLNSAIQSTRDTMKMLGIENKELLITEIGWPARNGNNDDQINQANAILETYVSGLEHQMWGRLQSPLFWFSFPNYPSNVPATGWHDYVMGVVRQSQSLGPPGTPKLAFHSHKQMTKNLKGKIFNKRAVEGTNFLPPDTAIETMSKFFIHEFENPTNNKKFWIAWKQSGEGGSPATIKFPVRTDSVLKEPISYTPNSGMQIAPARQDGWFASVIDTTPIYIFEDTTSILKRPDLAIDSLKVIPDTLYAFQTCTLKCWVRNIGNKQTPGNMLVKFYRNGEYVDTAIISSIIYPDSAILVTKTFFTWCPDTIVPGLRIPILYKAVVNESRSFMELSFDNNAKYKLTNLVRRYLQPDNQVKNWWWPDGFYMGDSIYNNNGANQSIPVPQCTDINQPAIFHIKIENDGQAWDNIKVGAAENVPPGEAAWTVRYYNAQNEGSDITDSIKTTSGWSTGAVNPGGHRVIRVEVTPHPPNIPVENEAKVVHIVSHSRDTFKLDVVSMSAVRKILQPDLQIKNHYDTDYIGNDVYDSTGAGQIKGQRVWNGQTAKYNIKIENDGEMDDSTYLKGPASDTNRWTIRYFSDSIDITNSVTNGTYWVFVPRNESKYIRLEVTPNSQIHGSTKECLISATSAYNPRKRDAVKAETKVRNPWIIENPVALYKATYPNTGKNLMRTYNIKNLHLVHVGEYGIMYSFSPDEGEQWYFEEVEDGLYPCLGLNYKGLPWIAYIRDSDLICKMKRQDGSWKEILIYDGNETRWAGPPSMVLATMPIKEGVKDYAYITYPVYEGTMPENIVV